MLRTLLLLMISVISQSILAQSSEQFQQWLKAFPPSVATQSYSGIEGTPYFNEKYAPAAVYTVQGKMEGVMLRYNVFRDQMELSLNSKDYTLGPLEQIVKVSFGSQVYKVVKYDYKDKAVQGYLEVLDSGAVSLFSKKIVAFKDKEAYTAFQSNPAPASFTKEKDVLLYRIGEGELVKFSSLQKMLELIPDKQNELNEYIKKEGIKGKKMEELVKVVKYYNSTLSAMTKGETAIEEKKEEHSEK